MPAAIKLEDDSLSESAVSAKDVFKRKTSRIVTESIKVGDDEVEIKIKALPVKQFTRLQDDHPPRKNNGKDANLGFNQDSFPPALFAASLIEPRMTEEEWAEIWHSEQWSSGELANLLDLVWGTTNRGFDVPFGGRS